MASKYPTMDWGPAASDEQLAEGFKLFKQKMQLVCEDNDITTDDKLARKIKIGLGDEGLRRLNASGLSEEDLKKPTKIWSFFENQLQVSINFRIQRLILMQMRQRTNECLDDFITRARGQALKCEFENKELEERIIELIIAGTANELFRRELLGKGSDLTLANALVLGRQYEAAARGADHIQSLKVDHIKKQNFKSKQPMQKGERCRRCDRVHAPRECPAFQTECKLCHKKGHWQKCCRTAKNTSSDSKKTNKKKAVHDVVQEQDQAAEMENESSNRGFYDVTLSNKCFGSLTTDKAYTEIQVQILRHEGQHPLRVKLDTGAKCKCIAYADV